MFITLRTNLNDNFRLYNIYFIVTVFNVIKLLFGLER